MKKIKFYRTNCLDFYKGDERDKMREQYEIIHVGDREYFLKEDGGRLLELPNGMRVAIGGDCKRGYDATEISTGFNCTPASAIAATLAKMVTELQDKSFLDALQRCVIENPNDLTKRMTAAIAAKGV